MQFSSWHFLHLQVIMGKLMRGGLLVATILSFPVLLLRITPASENQEKPYTSSPPPIQPTTTSSFPISKHNRLVDTPNISFASAPVREHTMGRELMDSIEKEQLPILFPNGVRNITKQVGPHMFTQKWNKNPLGYRANLSFEIRQSSGGWCCKDEADWAGCVRN